jgi:catechol 2,3-dioxygenase
MYTLPLDGEAVIAAAGDTAWSGVPAGTTMGHMHFYVGDVALARTFYLDGLGFEPMAEIPGALFAAAGGYHHHVGVNTWAAGQPIATDDDAKLLYWELALPDEAARDDSVARLRRAGYDVASAGGAEIATDPWGSTVRLVTSRAAAR